MKPACGITLVACLGLALSCGRQTALRAGTNSDPQKLPFDRPPQTAGISPSHSFVPSATRIPEGTAITVSLEHNLSSASAHSNDTFTAVLDDPIVIDGQTLVSPGALVTGRVLDAKSAGPPRDRGYLRSALTTLGISGKQLPVATSSLFARGGSREDRGAGPPSASANGAIAAPRVAAARDIIFAPGRRLTFRLTQNIDLQ